jgi:hypothetical protein
MKEKEPNVVSYDNIVIYNNDYKKLSSISIKDSTLTVDSINSETDLIVSSYQSSSICFLSPSKDTLLSKGNTKETGIVDYGTYEYSYAPTTGYFDMEYINEGNWYYIRTSEGVYSRIFIESYSSDSVVLHLEILADTGTYFGE